MLNKKIKQIRISIDQHFDKHTVKESSITKNAGFGFKQFVKKIKVEDYTLKNPIYVLLLSGNKTNNSKAKGTKEKFTFNCIVK